MTDTPSGRELVEKTFVYMTTLTKECRKAVVTRFEQQHKGLSFDVVESILRKEIESWFTERDRNVRVHHEKSNMGRPGEIMITYSGSTRDARFKFHVDSLFTLTGAAPNSPSYLKSMNVYVDKRDFEKP
jgi:lysine/ornithine N-monooxygenase